MNKKYELTYNPEHYTVAANDIIKGKQSTNLQTTKLVRLLITQVVKEDKDLKTYTCRITDLAKFLKIDPSNLYRDVREICKSALQALVYIGTGNPKEPWEAFNWMSAAKYDGDGNITLCLSERIKPYVLELDKWFTQYKLKNILDLNSFYAIRLYELIKCEDGITGQNKSEIEFEIKYLRQIFDCEKKYERISDFKRKVIEVGVREINDKTEYTIFISYKKTGRKLTSVIFEIHLNGKNINY